MKRLLLLIAFVLLSSQAAFATTYSVVAHTGKGATDPNTVTTDAIDTSTADLIIIGISDYGGITDPGCTPSDSKSNMWTGITAYTSVGGGSRTKIWYSRATSVGSGHTFTCAATSTYVVITVLAVSGSAASPLDQENGDHLNGSNDVQPGPITPTLDNELVVTVFCNDSVSITVPAPSGYTITDQVDMLALNRVEGAMAYQIQTTATATDPTWEGNANDEAAAIASFKVSAGGGGATPRNFTLMGVGQ